MPWKKKRSRTLPDDEELRLREADHLLRAVTSLAPCPLSVLNDIVFKAHYPYEFLEHVAGEVLRLTCAELDSCKARLTTHEGRRVMLQFDVLYWKLHSASFAPDKEDRSAGKLRDICCEIIMSTSRLRREMESALNVTSHYSAETAPASYHNSMERETTSISSKLIEDAVLSENQRI